ncbi:MAG TPA: 50S ribosomal protein L10 [Terriglobales bacterium]|nr:50S ribosomal protein L10 [Terriglobales bacterium]
MPLTKQQKQERLDALQKELRSATSLVVAGFNGLTVGQDFELRRQLRAAGARYRVVKNTLAARAAKGTAAEALLSGLKGVSSIAYTAGDAVALAKALQNYVKDNPSFQLRAGMVEGATISAAQVAQLAATPSKEELYAKLLFLIQAPAQRLVTALNGVGRSTAVVLDQAVQAKKFAE